MFKKLLTTMLVLTILVTAGSAIAGDASYKVYGKLHTSLNMLNNGDNSALGMTSNTSRFGIKGNNVLNDDFTFIWQFESKLMMTDGSGTELARRNTYVGFKHATAGQIRIGTHDTPFKTLGRKVEMFSDEMGDARSLTSLGHTNKWDNRLNEVIAWVSPDWDGFGVFVAYMMDQSPTMFADDDMAMTAFSGLASYSKDEIFVGVAMESRSEGFYSDAYADGATTMYGDAPSAMRFAGKYTAEKFKVSALYQMVSNEWVNDTNDGFEDVNTTTFGVGVQYAAAPKWNVKGQFYTTNFYTDAEDDAGSAGFDEGDVSASLMAIGVDHVVNKNVKVYAQWATITNGDMTGDFTNLGAGDSQSGFGGGVGGAAVFDTDGNFTGYEDPSGFSVGTVITW